MKILLLNSAIYDEARIIDAVSAYKDLADIKVVKRGDYWECRFRHCLYDEQETAWEFENYIIDLLNSKG